MVPSPSATSSSPSLACEDGTFRSICDVPFFFSPRILPAHDRQARRSLHDFENPPPRKRDRCGRLYPSSFLPGEMSRIRQTASPHASHAFVSSPPPRLIKCAQSGRMLASISYPCSVRRETLGSDPFHLQGRIGFCSRNLWAIAPTFFPFPRRRPPSSRRLSPFPFSPNSSL